MLTGSQHHRTLSSHPVFTEASRVFWPRRGRMHCRGSAVQSETRRSCGIPREKNHQSTNALSDNNKQRVSGATPPPRPQRDP
ncbi:hypothetical protein EYF80_044094 [Liparis tanakae]|uniref:Uncharacterized protein n=1 Tax=Liparis tanakae TaxID=230148 RepID=A0A4Z2FY88_9TELE|nr:hypothetical protein EYF80_044094 [Liparis tanakae]